MENAEKYLHSKSKPVKKAEGDATTILEEPIGAFEYDREGEVRVENEKIRLEFSYSFADYRDYVRGPDDTEGLLGLYPLSNGYRKLNRFVVADKATNKSIDILEDLPENYRVLFHPFFDINYGNARVTDKGCVILGDISSARGILTILHEIGHCIDYERTDDKRKWRRSHIECASNQEELKSVLSIERYAWAYALNKIRPLLRSGAFPQDEVLKDVHGEKGLLSYREAIRKTLVKMKDNQKPHETSDADLEEFESKFHELAGI